MSSDVIRSWGYIPEVTQRSIRPHWQPESCPEPSIGDSVLAYGNGRSYGDSCLNSHGTLIDTRSLDRFSAFDRRNGLLTAQSGVLLRDVLNLIVPAGWFLPVAPGTSLATLGGALANDVHGKNHHRDGTFGCFVQRFTLMRSNGQVLECSWQENTELFVATIGGLGLTGLVTEITIRLLPIDSADMDVRFDIFNGLQEFAALSAARKSTHQYTVAWLDCASGGGNFARGVFMAANHAPKLQVDAHDQANVADSYLPPPQLKPESSTQSTSVRRKQPLKNSGASKRASTKKSAINFPFNLPAWVLNSYSIGAFNALYYQRHKSLDGNDVRQHYRSFFFPLDAINNWNRIYGAGGFHQYQFVVPTESLNAMERVLKRIVASGMGSFLAVLKEFGDVPSPGLLSFPRAGFCLALDFANREDRTCRLLAELESMVLEAGGAVYPAKDRLMSPVMFKQSFPAHERFAESVDPGFSSDFWSRVNE